MTDTPIDGVATDAFRSVLRRYQDARVFSNLHTRQVARAILEEAEAALASAQHAGAGGSACKQPYVAARPIEACACAKLMCTKSIPPTISVTHNPWQRAVDEERISAHLGIAADGVTNEEARRLLGELIDWHIKVATDPAVNGGYKLVLDQGETK